jgi:hypothetical protein
MKDTCKISEILGAFPIINGFDCTEYALLLGLSGLAFSYLFWSQVTK